VPRFSPARPDVAADVTDTLQSWPLGAVAAVEQFGGAEINSNNFKVQTAAGTWLCKRAPLEAGPRLRQALALAAWLAPQHVAVPGPVPAHGDSLVVERGEWVWCVSPFVEGTFFHRGEAAVQSAAMVAGRLHRLLGRAPVDLWPVTRWAYGFEDAAEVLEAARRGSADWSRTFGWTAAEMLGRWNIALPRLARDLATRVTGWGPGVWQACHGDLHPHNVLINDDMVAAVVDVESLVVAPYPVACGFARYKLVRQAASAGGDPGGLGRVFAQVLRTSGPRDLLDDGDLRDGALAEVLRRLLLVLRLHYLEGNSRWNHVLLVHLAGLDEVAVIG